MKSEIQNFVDLARERGWNDERISTKLTQAGWEQASIASALEELVVPKPPTDASAVTASEALIGNIPHNPSAPISVVSNLTTRGFEYKIFSVSLTLLLFSIIFLANVLIGGDETSSIAAFPLTVLIVTGPIALLMFRRLHAAELATPSLRADASRRQVVQGIQLVTFLAVIIHTVVLLYLVISGHYVNKPAYGSTPNVFADSLRWLITLIVAGGTFYYYWSDERRKQN
ncbi:MAG: DUF5671 domain-containing protein [Patescibacteria group bacterium]|nr:DUF5671 domain-containing protein [Patescibacteria group bacterium]